MASASPPNPREIKSVNDLLNELSSQNVSGKELWYRGHQKMAWLLLPSVFRSEDYTRNETSMLARFKQEAATAGIKYQLDEWGWIAFAQHFSLPTRLLDWSLNPLVALYFACEPNPQDPHDEFNGEFFVLDPMKLNKDAGDQAGNPRLLVESDEELRKYLPGKDGDHSHKPRAVLAPLLFERIRAQTGTFTIMQSPSATEESFDLRDNRALHRWTIPGGSKLELREELRTLGFNEASIYRDLDRIAQHIKDALS